MQEISCAILRAEVGHKFHCTRDIVGSAKLCVTDPQAPPLDPSRYCHICRTGAGVPRSCQVGRIVEYKRRVARTHKLQGGVGCSRAGQEWLAALRQRASGSTWALLIWHCFSHLLARACLRHVRYGSSLTKAGICSEVSAQSNTLSVVRRGDVGLLVQSKAQCANLAS